MGIEIAPVFGLEKEHLLIWANIISIKVKFSIFIDYKPAMYNYSNWKGANENRNVKQISKSELFT